MRPLPRTSFHHQPEAQHPKSSAIHKLGRPITPSLGRFCCRSLRRRQRASGEDEAVDAVVCHLLHWKRIIAFDAHVLGGTYAKALLCSRRRPYQKLGEPPEVLSDGSQRELELGAPWPP